VSQISGIQEAELRQAFIKHLPQRLARLRDRCIRLCHEGWDINVVSIAFQDARHMAGLVGNAGLIEDSDNLHQLELFLEPLLREERLPSDSEISQLNKLASRLVQDNQTPDTILERENSFNDSASTHAEEPAYDTDLAQQHDNPEYEIGAIEDDEIVHGLETVTNANQGNVTAPKKSATSLQEELLLFPRVPGPPLAANPNAFILQLNSFGSTTTVVAKPAALSLEEELIALEKAAQKTNDPTSDIETLIEDEHEFELSFEDHESQEETPSSYLNQTHNNEQTEPSFPAKINQLQNTSTIYVIRGESDDVGLLLEHLNNPKYHVEVLRDLDDALKLISAQVPDALIVDSDYLTQLEEIGNTIKSIREKQEITLPFIAFSESKEISDRLKAMRAGTDAYFTQPADIRVVMEQLDELLLTGHDDPYRILIVEDDRTQAKFAESILKKAGMQPTSVLNALDVLDEMAKVQPDLVLMDLYMPECNGMELTALIREHDEFLGTPIVFLSGEQDEDKQFDALNMGGDDFLAKPIRPKHLIAAVQNRVRRARAQLHKMASTTQPQEDNITGLYQRGQLIDRLNQVLAEQEKPSGSLLILRLESPASIRNEIGYQSFEHLVNNVGMLLGQDLTTGSITSRFGEYSLAILMENKDREELRERCSNLVSKASKHIFEVDNNTLQISLVIGAVQLRDLPADASMIIATAESICEKAVSQSSRKFEIYVPPEQPKGEVSNQVIGTWIKDAIESNDLQVLYQPVMSLIDSSSEQYQTLLRLTTADGLVLPAAKLIPAAEQNNLILDVDRWIIKHALTVISRRDTAGTPVQLFVSQSAKSIREEGRVSWISQKLHARSIHDGGLVLDYRLPQVASQLRWAKEYFSQLQKEGIHVCLSQFDGSSMAMQLLKHLNVDYLKLTPAAISGSVGSMDLSTLLEQAHDANMRVIAPMIEDAQSAAKLWTSGIDYIQGNFVQKPDQHLAFDFSGSAL